MPMVIVGALVVKMVVVKTRNVSATVFPEWWSLFQSQKTMHDDDMCNASNKFIIIIIISINGNAVV